MVCEKQDHYARNYWFKKELAKGNIAIFNKQEKYNSEEWWDVEVVAEVFEQAREKKSNSSLNNDSALVVVIHEQIDCKKDD